MKLKFEGAKEQWDEIFTEEMMDTKELDAHTAEAKFPSIQGFIKEKSEKEYTRYINEQTLVEVKGTDIANLPYHHIGRIEKVNYNVTMMLLNKEEGEYALIDLMMVSEVNPFPKN